MNRIFQLQGRTEKTDTRGEVRNRITRESSKPRFRKNPKGNGPQPDPLKGGAGLLINQAKNVTKGENRAENRECQPTARSQSSKNLEDTKKREKLLCRVGIGH